MWRLFTPQRCIMNQNKIRPSAHQAAGFPLDEAKPSVCYGAEGDIGVELTILILKRELDYLVEKYKHNAIKTVDPIERFEWVVKHLSADYYRKADSFQSTMTALCPIDDPIPKNCWMLVSVGWCFERVVMAIWCLPKWFN